MKKYLKITSGKIQDAVIEANKLLSSKESYIYSDHCAVYEDARSIDELRELIEPMTNAIFSTEPPRYA